MPKYSTHVAFQSFALFPLGMCLYLFLGGTISDQLYSFSAGYFLSTLLFSPDLDIAHTFSLRTVRGILTLPFRPYSWFFSHRGLSHYFLLGTLTRIIWIATCSMIIYLICIGPLPYPFIMNWVSNHKIILACFIFGIAAADAAHILLDRLC